MSLEDGSISYVYCSSRGRPIQAKPEIDDRVLKVEGILVDTVQKHFHPALEIDFDDTVKTWAPADPEETYFVTGETIQDAFIHTLVADISSDLVNISRGGAMA